jgi:hypothetical protein
MYPPEEFQRYAAECVSMAKFAHDRENRTV